MQKVPHAMLSGHQHDGAEWHSSRWESEETEGWFAASRQTKHVPGYHSRKRREHAARMDRSRGRLSVGCCHVWTPPICKSEFDGMSKIFAVMYPAFELRHAGPPALMGFEQIRSRSDYRARWPGQHLGFG